MGKTRGRMVDGSVGREWTFGRNVVLEFQTIVTGTAMLRRYLNKNETLSFDNGSNPKKPQRISSNAEAAQTLRRNVRG